MSATTNFEQVFFLQRFSLARRRSARAATFILPAAPLAPRCLQAPKDLCIYAKMDKWWIKSGKGQTKMTSSSSSTLVSATAETTAVRTLQMISRWRQLPSRDSVSFPFMLSVWIFIHLSADQHLSPAAHVVPLHCSQFSPCRYFSGRAASCQPGRRCPAHMFRFWDPADAGRLPARLILPDEKWKRGADKGIQGCKDGGELHHQGCHLEGFWPLQLCGASFQMHPSWRRGGSLRKKQSISRSERWEVTMMSAIPGS